MTGIKFGKLLLISILIMLFLAACGDDNTNVTPSSNANPVPSTTPTQDWQNRWLRSIPCSPPCWEGITPGTTTADEALALLKKNTLFEDIIGYPDLPLNTGGISWKWSGSSGHGDIFYYNTSSKQNVYSIVPRYSNKLRFKEVIQAYGEPSHIAATARKSLQDFQTTDFSLLFAYVPYGFSIGAIGNTKFVLNQEIDLNISVGFFVPNEKGLADTVKSGGFRFMPWEGFKGFEYYCRDPYDDTGKSDCSKILKPTP